MEAMIIYLIYDYCIAEYSCCLYTHTVKGCSAIRCIAEYSCCLYTHTVKGCSAIHVVVILPATDCRKSVAVNTHSN